jgi:hypothetical protein
MAICKQKISAKYKNIKRFRLYYGKKKDKSNAQSFQDIRASRTMQLLLYFIATDNTANMIKTVSLLNDRQIDDPINDEEEKELSKGDEYEQNKSESDGDINVEFALSDYEFEVDEIEKDNEDNALLIKAKQ